MSNQKWYVSHAETMCQNFFGIIIGFIILHLWGLPLSESLTLQFIFFVAAYTRGYFIRRVFNHIGSKKNAKVKEVE